MSGTIEHLYRPAHWGEPLSRELTCVPTVNAGDWPPHIPYPIHMIFMPPASHTPCEYTTGFEEATP